MPMAINNRAFANHMIQKCSTFEGVDKCHIGLDFCVFTFGWVEKATKAMNELMRINVNYNYEVHVDGVKQVAVINKFKE